MRVIPYYCAQCGVRMQAEDARFGRSKADARTYYCPACVVDLDIEVADSGGVALESDSEASGRAGTVQSAYDLPRSKRLALRHRQSPSGSLRRSRNAPAPRPASANRTGWLLLLAGALGVVGLVAGRAWRTGDAEYRPSNHAAEPAPTEPRSETPPAKPAAETASAKPAAETPPVRPAAETASAKPAADAKPAAGSAAAEPSATAPTSYILNRRTGTLHTRGCRWERRMSDGNRRRFASIEEVEASGLRFKRCRTCLKKK